MTNDQIEILKRHSDALTNDVKNIEIDEIVSAFTLYYNLG